MTPQSIITAVGGVIPSIVHDTLPHSASPCKTVCKKLFKGTLLYKISSGIPHEVGCNSGGRLIIHMCLNAILMLNIANPIMIN